MHQAMATLIILGKEFCNPVVSGSIIIPQPVFHGEQDRRGRGADIGIGHRILSRGSCGFEIRAPGFNRGHGFFSRGPGCFNRGHENFHNVQGNFNGGCGDFVRDSFGGEFGGDYNKENFFNGYNQFVPRTPEPFMMNTVYNNCNFFNGNRGNIPFAPRNFQQNNGRPRSFTPGRNFRVCIFYEVSHWLLFFNDDALNISCSCFIM